MFVQLIAVWAAGHYRTHECVPNRDTRVQSKTIGTKGRKLLDLLSVGSVG
jgi:hypothetical protein